MKKNRFLVLSLFILCSCFVKAGYSDEYPSAYTRAFNNWITTQPTIDKANMNKSITRIELSKMISNYAINVLNKKPDTSKKCEFSDISDSLNTQYDNWVTNACQLWLMWQWITKFRPKDKVTRAEFWTILSRLLYWDKYNWWKPYYKKHLNQLYIRWIMTNISNATWNEVRGNVMVMLKRSETLWNHKIPSFDELNKRAFKCYVCYPEDDCGYYEFVEKKWFIIPYKDWYIWYDWLDDGLGDERLNLTYRKIDNPCEIAYQTDELFHYNYDYNGEGCNLRYWYSEKMVEKFSFKEEDIWKCTKEQERFFYNLLVWSEKDEIFTLWMNSFKNNIDNNSFSKKWREKYYECMKNFELEYDKEFDIEDFMKDFDPEEYMKEVNEYNAKKEEYWYLCIKEILKK